MHYQMQLVITFVMIFHPLALQNKHQHQIEECGKYRDIDSVCSWSLSTLGPSQVVQGKTRREQALEKCAKIMWESNKSCEFTS